MRQTLLDGLRQRIKTIERTPPVLRADDAKSRPRAWQLGLSDRAAGVTGVTFERDLLRDLDRAATHELKPEAGGAFPAAAGWMAAQSFALALTGRLLAAAEQPTPAEPPIPGGRPGPATISASGSASGGASVFWCTSRARAADLGRCYGPGLARYGVDPSRLVVVEVARANDVLWALEEVVRSGTGVLAIGLVDAIAATPARRLALATAAQATPCLLLTGAHTPPALSTATRWRLAPAPSCEHPFEPRAPGQPRLAVRLERCRTRPLALSDHASLLEWCDASFRFRLAATSGDRETGRPEAWTGAG